MSCSEVGREHLIEGLVGRVEVAAEHVTHRRVYGWVVNLIVNKLVLAARLVSTLLSSVRIVALLGCG